MKILVIIVSYNFERWIKPCLDSLRKSDVPLSVVVVDNASQDHTVERIRNEYPEVRLLPQKDNLGFGKANNIGFRIALQEDFDFVFLLNEDAWVDPGTIRTLAQTSLRHPEYGILSPIHLTGDRSKQDSGFPVQAAPYRDGEVRTIDFVNAALWLIPCKVLKEVGGFSSLFYHYGEDVDFVHRLHYHGYKVGYCPVYGCHDRAQRVVTKPMEHRGKSVYLLTVAADIQLSAPKAFTKSYGGCFQLIFKSLLHADWNSVGFYTRFLFRLLKDTCHIANIRMLCAKAGSHFIN